MTTIRTHKDLIVWQKSVALASKIYSSTECFPNCDRHMLSIQMRRAAISVASNIAEGVARGNRAESIRFLDIARGSLSELETQVYISLDLKLIDHSTRIEEQVAEVGRLLNALHRKLQEHRERANGFQPVSPPLPM